MNDLLAYLSFLDQKMLGIPCSVYALSFLAIMGGFFVKAILSFVLKKIRKLVSKTKVPFDDIMVDSISSPLQWFAVVTGFYIAASLFPLPEEPVNIARFVPAIFKGITVFLVVWVLVRMTNDATALWIEKARQKKSKIESQVAPIVKRGLKAFLIVTGALLFMQNLGYSVGGLLAGLGIGGMAVALASKDTLSNIFGAIVIFVDKPFQTGDWIEVGNIEGVVEEIKLRTTTVRTFANSLITLPNSSLTTTAINNWSRMKKRRIQMTVGITYDTPPDKVEKAVQSIKEIILNDPAIHSDFFLVYFNAFGPYSLDIFIYCFTVATQWAEFLSVKEKFMLKIMKAFKELGVEFAFPTQTLFLSSVSSQTSAGQIFGEKH
jgi:MscS family membrane protein